jgi:hypothetical protein
LNYFNYFTEIEEAFIRRRGKHLLLSPMDWALIESWKEMGVPLHVALRGIEQAFDSYEARPRKRSVKTLFYCQEEVEAQYAEWLESQLGAGPDEATTEGELAEGVEPSMDARLPFPRASILEHLARSRAGLLNLLGENPGWMAGDFSEAVSRAIARLAELEAGFARSQRPDAEALEDALTSLERMLDEALLASTPQAETEAAQVAAAEQLKPYRARMEQAVYAQTLNNLLLKRLREQSGLPRLSLFYL